jgi:hypothetical protein
MGKIMTHLSFVSPLGEQSHAKSSVKGTCEIADLWVGKDSQGNYYAYLLAGTDEERQAKYGERIYAHTITPDIITELNREHRARWGFLPVKKLPRWRKMLRSGIGFLTLVGGTTVLTPILGLLFALAVSAASAMGTRKLATCGKSVNFSAEAAGLRLINGQAPKLDYDKFQRLVEARNSSSAHADTVVC